MRVRSPGAAGFFKRRRSPALTNPIRAPVQGAPLTLRPLRAGPGSARSRRDAHRGGPRGDRGVGVVRRLGAPGSSARPAPDFFHPRRRASGPRGSARVARRRPVAATRAGWGESVSPDLNHTEEAFSVPLDRIAPGAFVSVAVRADATPDAAIDALVAVVRVRVPGDVQLHWGLGAEGPEGLSSQAWECPPETLMPPGSVCVANWASGFAVRSPLDRDGVVEIPSRAGPAAASRSSCTTASASATTRTKAPRSSSTPPPPNPPPRAPPRRRSTPRAHPPHARESSSSARRGERRARRRASQGGRRARQGRGGGRRGARRARAVEEQSAYERMQRDAQNPMAQQNFAGSSAANAAVRAEVSLRPVPLRPGTTRSGTSSCPEGATP